VRSVLLFFREQQVRGVGTEGSTQTQRTRKSHLLLALYGGFMNQDKPEQPKPGIVVKQVGDTFEIKVTNMNASQIVSVVRELEKCALDLMKRDAGMQK